MTMPSFLAVGAVLGFGLVYGMCLHAGLAITFFLRQMRVWDALMCLKLVPCACGVCMDMCALSLQSLLHALMRTC